MRNKYLLAVLLGLFFMPILKAQHFNKAVGLRLGAPLSLSYKTFLTEKTAIEGFVGTRGFAGFRWYNVGASYQIHTPLALGDADGLEFYYGGGASAYFFTFDTFFENESSTSFGIQGNVGVQYTFSNVPITVTMDWMPTVFFSGISSGFSGGFGGVGIRYILSKNDDIPEREYSESSIQQATSLPKLTKSNVSTPSSKKAAPIAKESNTAKYPDSRSASPIGEKSKLSQSTAYQQIEDVATDKKSKKSKKKKKVKKKKSKKTSRYTM